MKAMASSLLLLLFAAAPAPAGKNADGALIVHTTGLSGYRYYGCDSQYDDPGTCENAGTQLDPNVEDSRVIWLIAAFPDDAEPGVSSISFGVRHNYPPDLDWFYGWNFCGPEGTTEAPDPEFPSNWQSGGNQIFFGEPIQASRLFPFYWIAAYGLEGHFVGTGPHPSRPTGFYDDSAEPEFDECGLFGAVGWGQPGFNECPGIVPVRGACCVDGGYCFLADPEFCLRFGGEPLPDETSCTPNPCFQEPFGACCHYDGACEIMRRDLCEAEGNMFLGEGTDCDPNLCSGACCYLNDACFYRTEAFCNELGGEYLGGGTVCDPNPCPLVEAPEGVRLYSTWGRLKTRYR